jgi:cobalt-zinc-cadmium efflux system outer membrane protein
MITPKNARWLSIGFLFLSGCTSMGLDAGFQDVRTTVEERHQVQIFWNNGTELDKEAAKKLGSLLNRKLTADDAVQIALLNNRELQAVYSDLGVAQADLVQAGLLSNPIFDAAIMFPVSGRGRPDLELSAAMNFLNIFYIPLRKRIAAARFEETKTRVTGSVLDFAGRVRSAFFAYEADEQMLELRQAIVQALDASFEIARRLSEAGNITDLDLARERAQFEAAKLALRAAEGSVRQNREELNVLMGLWGAQTQWQTEGRLPEIPEQTLETKDIERLALERSLDLVQTRQRVIGAGEELGLTRWTTLLPDFSAGPKGERNDGAWEVGPQLEFAIPLFDQGQARSGRAAAELRRFQQEYYALGVRIRAQARAVRDRLEGGSDRAMYYRDILLPLHERIVNEAQLQYNAMQLGPFQLLRAREQQIQSAVAYIEALRDYWLARGDLGQLLSGRLPNSGAAPARTTSGQTRMNQSEGH